MFTEEFWTNLDYASPYQKSKTRAEKAAWQFLEDLSPETRFELVTINPSMIVGPSHIKSYFQSSEVIVKFLDGTMPGAPLVNFTMVDVRECAAAHLQAVLRKEAAGNRFILHGHALMGTEMANSLHKEFGKSYTINTQEIPYWKIYIASFFSKTAGSAYRRWGKAVDYDTKKSQEILGIKYRPIEETLRDGGNWLIDAGYLPDKRK